MARVVLAMSGGVDSSVAAHLLKQQGHEVIGVFMRHGEKSVTACSVDGRRESSPLLPVLNHRSGHKQGCCSASDAEDGARVAARLEIPWYALNLEAEFRDIIDYFVDEYCVGRTPNPCVMCNNRIKFGKLFDYADSVSADFLATGHYARLENIDGEMHLSRGIDNGKDQSYVLFGIKRGNLNRMLLPVGHFDKPTIRRIASQLGLNVAEKKDSQEICFVTSGRHDEFVRTRRPDNNTSGRIRTLAGAVVGTHPGIEGFTIGQRKGLGVAMGEPYFVVRIDPVQNDVYIGRRDDLATQSLTAGNANWLVEGMDQGQTLRGAVQFRYNSRATPATTRILADKRIEITFDTLQHGVSPGQAAVCYDGERVLGGAWIEATKSAADPD